YLLSYHPPPPTTTYPLPYTTLFRSDGHASDLGVGDADDGRHQHHREPHGFPRRDWRDHWHHVVDDYGLHHGGLWNDVQHHHWHEDRKSTRLNSSHVSISYAVFCLKK